MQINWEFRDTRSTLPSHHQFPELWDNSRDFFGGRISGRFGPILQLRFHPQVAGDECRGDAVRARALATVTFLAQKRPRVRLGWNWDKLGGIEVDLGAPKGLKNEGNNWFVFFFFHTGFYWFVLVQALLRGSLLGLTLGGLLVPLCAEIRPENPDPEEIWDEAEGGEGPCPRHAAAQVKKKKNPQKNPQIPQILELFPNFLRVFPILFEFFFPIFWWFSGEIPIIFPRFH